MIWEGIFCIVVTAFVLSCGVWIIFGHDEEPKLDVGTLLRVCQKCGVTFAIGYKDPESHHEALMATTCRKCTALTTTERGGE